MFSGGDRSLVAGDSAERLISLFAERGSFTGVYRNEARSEICFLSAGMFDVEVSQETRSTLGASLRVVG